MPALVLRIVTLGNQQFLQVVNQSYTGLQFGILGSSFQASNGFNLRSSVSPAIERDSLYVRGSNSNMDTDVMPLNCMSPINAEKYIERLTQAVKEYNLAKTIVMRPSSKEDYDAPISQRTIL